MSATTPVGTFAQSNYTSQTQTAYPLQIDANWAVAQRSVDNFAPTPQSTPNMTIRLDDGHLFNGSVLLEVAAQNTSTFSAPFSHPRIDRVVVDSATGVQSIVAGTEAVSPVAPAIPAGKSPVARVLLQTTTTSINGSMIADERDFSKLGAATAIPTSFGALSSMTAATSVDLGTQLTTNIQIIGTTSILSFGSSASVANPLYLVTFTSSLTLVYNATSMILPGAANILTNFGDICIAQYLGGGNWRIGSYVRGQFLMGSNAQGNKTFSAAAPSGGNPGDIWYQT